MISEIEEIKQTSGDDQRIFLERGKQTGGLSMVWERPNSGAIGVLAKRSIHAKCERCWNLRPTVGLSPEHPTLCDRCVRVVSELNIGA